MTRIYDDGFWRTWTIEDDRTLAVRLSVDGRITFVSRIHAGDMIRTARRVHFRITRIPAYPAPEQLTLPIVPETAECADCGDVLPVGELEPRGSGRSVCPTCAENYHTCERCGRERDRGEMTANRDGDLYCDRCYNESFTTCQACDEECSVDDCRHSDGGHGPYCQTCYDDRYGCCEDCGEEFRTSDLDDDGHCSDCREDDDDSRQEEIPRCFVSPGFLTQRAFAVEIECYPGHRENTARAMRMADWKAEHDGSLGDGGIEFCSGAVRGQEGIDKIREASKLLRSDRTRVDRTCGLHVHIDATSESAEVVSRFVYLCKRLEHWALSVVPNSRRDQRYCQNLPSEADRAIDTDSLEMAVYGQKPSRGWKAEKYNGARYRWINCHSWFYRGTVEVRLHSGTISQNKILRWVELWLHAFEFAKSHSRDELSLVQEGFGLMEAMQVKPATINYFRQRQAKFADASREDRE